MTVDAEEAAVMLLRTADGAIGTVEATKIATGSQDELRIEIHGRHGALRFNLMQPNCLQVYDERLPDGEYGGKRGWQRLDTVQRFPAPGGRFPSPKGSIGWLRGHVHCLYSFLKSIAEGVPARPSLTYGVYLQQVLAAVHASAASGQWVDLPQPSCEV